MIGYTDTIRQWATDTRRAGILVNADGTGEVGLDSKELGHRLAARFTLKVDFNLITDARYQVFGCGFSMATCAVAADLSVGYTLDDAAKIDAKKLTLALEGLPKERDYCAELAVEALRAAIKSARGDHALVQTSLSQEDEHGPLLTDEDALYAGLLNSTKPEQVSSADRHLFACLLAAAAREPYGIAAALGLASGDVLFILETYFPGVDHLFLERHAVAATETPPEINQGILSILLSHVAVESDSHKRCVAVKLAHVLAARAAHAGHLWVAMGLFERPDLSAAIGRHLPSLAAANHQNMRWKRYLYKQLCDLNGGTMCKAPNCGVCSDYALCFAPEE